MFPLVFIRLMLLSSTVFWKASFIFIVQQIVIYISFPFCSRAHWCAHRNFYSNINRIVVPFHPNAFHRDFDDLDLTFFRRPFHCSERMKQWDEGKKSRTNGITFKAVGILFSHQNGIYPRNMIMCISNPLQLKCVLLDWRFSSETWMKIIWISGSKMFAWMWNIRVDVFNIHFTGNGMSAESATKTLNLARD